MPIYTKSLEDVIKRFSRLPGIGIRTAERLAFHLLTAAPDEAQLLADSLHTLVSSIKYCPQCHNISDGDLCFICGNARRIPTHICVVEEPKDITAIEKTGVFRGLYHVLHGVINPLEGIGPDHLKIEELIARLKAGGVDEVTLAMDSDTEGETTALYLSRLIKPLGIKLTRIACGLPVGGDLDYADGATLVKAMEGRTIFC